MEPESGACVEVEGPSSDSGILPISSCDILSSDEKMDSNILKKGQRSTRSQNPDFAAKQRTFLQRVTSGVNMVSESEGSDISDESLTTTPIKDTSGKENYLKRRRFSVDASDSCCLSGSGSDVDKPPIKRSRSLSADDSPKFSNGSENVDKYCWMCHREGTVVQCQTCPRVYHLKCIQLETAPTDYWVCPECVVILHAENTDTRSHAMQLISLDQLCVLLKYALTKMKSYSGTEPFWQPVDLKEFPSYRDFVAHPMDFSLLERNIRRKMYGSTEAFLADTKWILHDCIVFNTVHSKLSSTARGIVKICRQEMTEIELCPDCYLCAQTRKDSWFIDVCKSPHVLVWAKLKSFPYWPGKVMRVNFEEKMVDVRFFGSHDRAWVPLRDIFLYSRNIPVPTRNKKHNLEACIEEVEHHIKKLRDTFGRFEYAPFRTQFDPYSDQIKLLLPTYNGGSPIKLNKKRHLKNPGRTYEDPVMNDISNPQILDEVKKEVMDEVYCNNSQHLPVATDSEPESDKSESPSEDINIGSASLMEWAKFEEAAAKISLASMEQHNGDLESSPSPERDFRKRDHSLSSCDSVSNFELSQPFKRKLFVHEDKRASVNEVSHKNSDESSEDEISKTDISSIPGNLTKFGVDVSKVSSLQPIVCLRKLKLEDIVTKVTSYTSNIVTKQFNERESNDFSQVSSYCDKISEDADGETEITEEYRSDITLSLLENPHENSTDNTLEKEAEPQIRESEVIACRLLEDLLTNIVSNSNQVSIEPIFNSSIVPPTPELNNNYEERSTENMPNMNAGNETGRNVDMVRSPPLKDLIATIKEEPADDYEDRTVESNTVYPQDLLSRVSRKEIQITCIEKQASIAKSLPETNTTIERISSEEQSRVKSCSPASSSDRDSVLPAYLYPNVTITVENNKQVNTNGLSKEKSKNNVVKSVALSDAVSLSVVSTKTAVKSNKPVPSTSLEMECESDTEDAGHTKLPLTVQGPSMKKQIPNFPEGPPPLKRFRSKKSVPPQAPPPSIIVNGPSQPCSLPLRAQCPSFPGDTNNPENAMVYIPSVQQHPRMMNGHVQGHPPPPRHQMPPPRFPLMQQHHPRLQSAPAEAGPATAELSKNADKLANFFRNSIEEMLRELSNIGNPEATIKTLQLELEKLQWRHQQEMAELKHNTDLIMVEMRANLISEHQRKLSETVRQCEAEKQRAIEETKKKQWCTFCGKEAVFYCCWNTSYCDYPCQQRHWPQHMANCAQSSSPMECNGKREIEISKSSITYSNFVQPPSDSVCYKIPIRGPPPLSQLSNSLHNTSSPSRLVIDEDVGTAENSDRSITESLPGAMKTNGSRDASLQKRKRCGICQGCTANPCGVCPPCKNSKTHQVCRKRQCLSLKKVQSTHLVVPSVPVPSTSKSQVPPPPTFVQRNPRMPPPYSIMQVSRPNNMQGRIMSTYTMYPGDPRLPQPRLMPSQFIRQPGMGFIRPPPYFM